jgi:meiotically up-regulated gene 157 (Mug157) protein
MKRPASIKRFLSTLQQEHQAGRVDRIDRYTEQLFARALTQDTEGRVFVMTGDIPAMWLRDSTWQMRPLLAMHPDSELSEIIGGVSRMQARYVAIDPYANAFNATPSGDCWHRDFPDQSAWVFERKFEIDSLAAFLDLALRLATSTGYTEHLDDAFWEAAGVTLDTLEREAHHETASYRFTRAGSAEHDALSHDGYGAPFAECGFIWSAFRPSDDRCVYPFHIPGNAHLSVVLAQLATRAQSTGHAVLASRASSLAKTISAALATLATRYSVLPYEVDGLGNAIFMDDPNIPSLLALPYLGWCEPNDAQYRATRTWLLSPAHEYFASGHFGEGFTSDHTPSTHIWPLSIAMRGLTAVADDGGEQEQCLRWLEASDGGTGSLHESFNKDDSTCFTRPWFSWADMTYVELALAVMRRD